MKSLSKRQTRRRDNANKPLSAVIPFAERLPSFAGGDKRNKYTGGIELNSGDRETVFAFELWC